MNDPMIEEMIQEMDSAYETVVQKQKQDKTYYDPNTDKTSKELTEAVTRVVQKYFPLGMRMEDAFKLLHQLKEQDFEIVERRHEGMRKWPEGGELYIYRDELVKRVYQPPGSMVDYEAQKRYEYQLMIFEKHAFITIRTDGEKIISSEGRIWPQTNLP